MKWFSSQKVEYPQRTLTYTVIVILPVVSSFGCLIPGRAKNEGRKMDGEMHCIKRSVRPEIALLGLLGFLPRSTMQLEEEDYNSEADHAHPLFTVCLA